jgi:hypothetical protein
MTIDARSESRGEDAILHVLMIAIGLIPVLIACATGGRFGVEATLGGLMMAIGLRGLVFAQA